MRHRGTQDILVAVVDGLKGFPEAIESVFPEARVQTCIVHLIRFPPPGSAGDSHPQVISRTPHPTERCSRTARHAWHTKAHGSTPEGVSSINPGHDTSSTG